MVLTYVGNSRAILKVRDMALINVLKKLLFSIKILPEIIPWRESTSVKAASTIVKKAVDILYTIMGINTPQVFSKVDNFVFFMIVLYVFWLICKSSTIKWTCYGVVCDCK